jgi:hypothetical protein
VTTSYLGHGTVVSVVGKCPTSRCTPVLLSCQAALVHIPLISPSLHMLAIRLEHVVLTGGRANVFQRGRDSNDRRTACSTLAVPEHGDDAFTCFIIAHKRCIILRSSEVTCSFCLRWSESDATQGCKRKLGCSLPSKLDTAAMVVSHRLPNTKITLHRDRDATRTCNGPTKRTCFQP